MAEVSGLTGCISNDTSTGRLSKLGDEIAALKSFKADPSQILVAALTGPVAPYSVEMVSRTTPHGVTEPQPSVVHSCMQSSSEYADPAVRIQQWVQAFGANGLSFPICAGSFAPAMAAVGQQIAQALEPRCYQGSLPVNLETGLPACRVVDRSINAQGQVTETQLPACAVNASRPPCWDLAPNTAFCPGTQAQLVVERGTTDVSSIGATLVSCD
jgi:hypothetical protein